MEKNRWILNLSSRSRQAGKAQSTEDPEREPEQELPNPQHTPDERTVQDIEYNTIEKQLCDGCRSIRLWELRDPNRAADNHLPITAPLHTATLHSSAKRCPSCKIIAQTIHKSGKIGIHTEDKKALPGCPIHFQRRRPYAFGEPGRISLTTGLHSDIVGQLSLFAEQGSPALISGDIRLIPPGRPNGIDRISTWLQICKSHHLMCTSQALHMQTLPDDLALLPTRVIDVGPPYARVIALLESKGKRGQYLTLSHRWGEAEVLKTTMRTLNQFQSKIPTEKLCQNFQDAIAVTRRLGFRYLWIDSLCIIQDSIEDWDNESSRMADIYLYSSLTICASDASDGNAGFLHKRPPLEEEFAKLPYVDKKGITSGHYYIAPKYRSIYEPDVFPLNRRGWTLQESILARRSVLFSKDQLHWECQSASWDEGEIEFQTDESRKFKGKKLAKLISYGSDKLGLLRFEPWYDIVKQYTDRQLTFESDKLPALSGLASSFQRIMGYRYAAGLWEEDIPRGLLWSSGLRQELFRRPKSPRAPSWSWASVDGHVEFPFPEGKPQISDIKIEMQYSGSDPFGKVDYGTITLMGRIRSITRGGRVTPRDDILQRQLLSFASHIKDIQMLDLDGHVAGKGQFDTLEDITAQVYCLLVRVNPINDHSSPDSLLLTKEDSGRNTFRRMGVLVSLRNEVQSPPSPGPPTSPLPPLYRSAALERITLV